MSKILSQSEVDEFSIYNEYVQRISTRHNLIEDGVKKQRDRDIALDVNSREDFSSERFELPHSSNMFTKEQEEKSPKQNHYSKELEPVIYSSKYMLAPIDQKFESSYKFSPAKDDKIEMLQPRENQLECSCEVSKLEVSLAQ